MNFSVLYFILSGKDHNEVLPCAERLVRQCKAEQIVRGIGQEESMQRHVGVGVIVQLDPFAAISVCVDQAVLVPLQHFIDADWITRVHCAARDRIERIRRIGLSACGKRGIFSALPGYHRESCGNACLPRQFADLFPANACQIYAGIAAAELERRLNRVIAVSTARHVHDGVSVRFDERVGKLEAL